MNKRKSNKRSFNGFNSISLSLSIKTYLVDAFILFLLLIAIISTISLASFTREDAAWTTQNIVGETSYQNAIGLIGAWISDLLYSFFGVVAWIVPSLFYLVAFAYLFNKETKEIVTQSSWIRFFIAMPFGLVLIAISSSALVAIHFNFGQNYFPQGSEGILGKITSSPLILYLNKVGATIFVIFLFLLGITAFFKINWKNFISNFLDFIVNSSFYIKQSSLSLRANIQTFLDKRKEKNSRQKFLDEHKAKINEMPEPKIVPAEKKVEEGKKVHKEKQQELFKDPAPGDMAKIGLLDEKETIGKEISSKEKYELEILKEALITKLAEFKITGPEGEYAVVKETMRGPVVTRFEVELPKGIKVSQVSNLNKDLARSLGVGSIRIVEVIEGRETIGIEVPNSERENVLLSEIIASKLFEDAKSSVSLAFGKNIEGVPVVEDLAGLPHMLVAGTTGSGKSVALNSMLMSILYKATPDQVKFVLIDPKMLELSVYEDLPHLLCPVITDMSEAANGLRWCVNEMEKRYRLMASLSVRNLNGLNSKIRKAREDGEPLTDPLWKRNPEKEDDNPPELEELPLIVIAVDELADLMMVVGKKVEHLIARLAQKARAAGIHMLLATQRPSVDVITGLIKANISARMAFNVASSMDSRVVLDQVGAEQLLGKGDMLYIGSGTSIPLRVHGAYVGEEEIIRVVEDWKNRQTVSYLEEVTKSPESSEGPNGESDEEKDEFYDQAVAFVIDSRRASISAVQRKFRIGYNRAARLIETMESAGIVSEMNSNGNREVLSQKVELD